MNLNERVLLCREDENELNSVIDEYKPFIASVVQKQVGRYVEYGKDDELSIGLMAFEEAIRSYNKDKGSFLSFAEGVIKRRLIDYFRKESRHSKVIPISSFYNEEDDKEIDITEGQSLQAYDEAQESEYRKYEIIEIQKELKDWGISFFELPDASPKHKETKEVYKTIVDAVISDEKLLNQLKAKKYFPVAEIERITGIHRKTIERSRKYAIALTIILTGEYRFIQGFINRR